MRNVIATRRIGEWAWRVIPITLVVGITSLVLSLQIVRPHRRLIKSTILLGLMMLIFRFDMIYSIYLFIFLFPFPSGTSLGGTNTTLMTLIPLIWAIRAYSSREKIFPRTEIDKFIILLIVAYMISFFNVETAAGIKGGLVVFWRQLAAIAFFYLIVNFVSDEKKLERTTQVICVSAGFVFLTGVIELLFPGAIIIPGWIGLPKQFGEGMLGFRLQGIRLGGAVASHSILSDYATLTLFFMVFHFFRSRNPILRLFWSGLSAMTFIIMLATANRGAIAGFVAGLIYFLYVFRKSFSLVKYIGIIAFLIGVFAAGQVFLEKYTLAVSITKRFTDTKFYGIVPETRVDTWAPALARSTDHILIGHGPKYEVGAGLRFVYWPHNAYIFYLYTIGLVGLSAFLLIIYRLMRMSLMYSKKFLEGTSLGSITAILNIQLVIFLVEQLRTDHQRDNIYIFIVWMFFGLIVAAAAIIKRKEKELQESGAT